jgi:predicted DNA-binding transcriptional regulator AlpA
MVLTIFGVAHHRRRCMVVYLSYRQTANRLGYSDTYFGRLVASGVFPRAECQIAHMLGWSPATVDQWIARNGTDRRKNRKEREERMRAETAASK